MQEKSYVDVYVENGLIGQVQRVEELLSDPPAELSVKVIGIGYAKDCRKLVVAVPIENMKALENLLQEIEGVHINREPSSQEPSKTVSTLKTNEGKSSIAGRRQLLTYRGVRYSA